MTKISLPNADPRRVTLESVEETLLNSLPVELAAELKFKIDAKSVEKHGFSRLRLLVYPRRGRGFWSSGWCDFEIGIGSYPGPGSGLALGAVMFFCAIEQAKVGSGKFRAPICQILTGLAKGEFSDWEFITPGRGSDGSQGQSFALQNRYFVSDSKEFPIEAVARDGSRLIQTVLRAIDAMLAGRNSNYQ